MTPRPGAASSARAAPVRALPRAEDGGRAAEKLNRTLLAVSVGLAAATLLAFLPVWRPGGPRPDFIDVDDPVYVVENPHVLGGLTGPNFAWAWSLRSAEKSDNWHPLTWLSLQLDAGIWGRDPYGYHLTNVLLHAASGVLLFWVLWRMTAALWPSALVAGLFALHPLRVESVAWVAERKDVLGTFFWMLTLLVYTGYVRRLARRADRVAVFWYLAVAVVYFLGLTAKPMLVTLPFVLLLLDYWPLGRFGGADGPRPASRRERRAAQAPDRGAWTHPTGGRRLVLALAEKVPLLALSGLCIFFTLRAQQALIKPLPKFPHWVRQLNAVDAYVLYLWKMIFPRDLAFFYPHPGTGISVGWALGAFLLLLAVTALAVWQVRRRPYLAVGWFWYLGTLVPVIGLVQVGVQAMADRYTYVPLVGIYLALVWGAFDLVAGFPRPAWVRWAASGAAAVVLLACGAATYTQAGHWRDSETLWKHTREATGDNAMAEYYLGRIYAEQSEEAQRAGNMAEAQKKAEEAVSHLQKAVHIDRENAFAHDLLGVMLGRRGEYPGAIEHFQEALRIHPEFAEVYDDRGVTRTALGRKTNNPTLLEQAEQDYREALARRWPRPFPLARYHLGVLLLSEAKTPDQLAEATLQLEGAVREDDGSGDAHAALGRAYGQAGNYEKARGQLVRAVELSPREAEYRYYLGYVLHQLGRDEDAEAQLHEAAKLAPGWPEGAARTAWRLATSAEAPVRNGALAVQLAQTACLASAQHPRPEFYDILAAAYAEAGDFAHAVEAQKHALALAAVKADRGLAQGLSQRLRLYEQKKPFREAPPGGRP